MITVMGATGRVGTEVLRALAGKGKQVRAISRTAQTGGDVEWISADAQDADSLARAFDGAEAVFAMNPIAPDAADVYGSAARLSASVAKALTMAQVPYVVALSSQGAQLASGTGVVVTLHDFEQALLRTGIPMTRLRPAYFTESWQPMAAIAAETAELPAFLHPLDKAIPTISVRDVGRFAARFLCEPAPGIANLTGPRACSELDAAQVLTALLGRAVTPSPVPQDQIAPLLEQAGLGASLAEGTAALYAAINEDRVPFEPADMQLAGSTGLEQVLGPIAANPRAVA